MKYQQPVFCEYNCVNCKHVFTIKFKNKSSVKKNPECPKCYSTLTEKIIKKRLPKNTISLEFSCTKCQLDFEKQYTSDIGELLLINPRCPNCGSYKTIKY